MYTGLCGFLLKATNIQMIKVCLEFYSFSNNKYLKGMLNTGLVFRPLSFILLLPYNTQNTNFLIENTYIIQISFRLLVY